MSNQNQPQPNITSQEVVLHFEKEIPDEYRSAFGEYFLGIKDFVKFCYGKNIAMNIEINGSLIIKAFSKNSEDKLLEVVVDTSGKESSNGHTDSDFA